MKQITKATNKRTIMVNYALTIIFISIGMYTNQSMWYVIAVVFLGFALFRKYWLMKRLKKIE